VCSKLDEHFTTIFNAMSTRYCSLLDKPVNQLNRAVMSQAQSLRKSPDCRAASLRKPFNGQEDLVLLWLDSLRPRSFFAQVQKLADAIAEFGELPVSRGRYLFAAWSRQNFLAAQGHARHPVLISYHDVPSAADLRVNRNRAMNFSAHD
jgi:hypothetical protein